MKISETLKSYAANSLLVLPTAIVFSTVIGMNTYLEPKTTPIIQKEVTEFVYKEKTLAEKRELCTKNKDCMLLVEAGYFETRGEVDMGVIGIMQVILNRVDSNHPIFVNQKSIKEVLYKPSQFSYTHEQYLKGGMRDKEQVKRLKVVAWDVLQDEYEDLTNGSLYYHELTYSPHWSKVYAYQMHIDRHVFYKH